jgi:hypothetical protein
MDAPCVTSEPRMLPLREGKQCVALQFRHRDMECEEALHESVPLPIGWRRHDPLLGFPQAIIDPRVELLRSVGRRQALQMTEKHLDCLSNDR